MGAYPHSAYAEEDEGKPEALRARGGRGRRCPAAPAMTATVELHQLQ